MNNRLRSYYSLIHPVYELRFRKPLVIFHSDDWGLLGIRGHKSFQHLVEAGVALGKNPYDYYSLETTEDLEAFYKVLSAHRDSIGNPPIFVFNFLLANIDFSKVIKSKFQKLCLKPLYKGIPEPWACKGLMEVYKKGIQDGYIYPALHGLTHFCYPAVEKVLTEDSPRGGILRLLIQEGSMLRNIQLPWIGFEFKDEGSIIEGGWLSFLEQLKIISREVKLFRRTFNVPPVSVCAAGYRANPSSFRAWAQAKIKIVQMGPSISAPPYLGQYGLLYLHRNVSFEPAFDPSIYTAEKVFQKALRSIKDGYPIVVCMHSINFQSTLCNYQDITLKQIDYFLSLLEKEFDDLLYIHDENLWQIARKGYFCRNGKHVQIDISQKLSVSPTLKHILFKK